MDASLVAAVENSEGETAGLELKASFDPAAAGNWCELVKDIVAIANSGGGVIVFGINDDGTPGSADLAGVLSIDPATIVDKIRKYTGQHYAGCSVASATWQAHPVVIMSVAAVPIPIVFTAPGTYDIGGGKQKTAFSIGTVYFRHGAKSEPATSEDLRISLDRELERIRSSWLDGIKKVVTAPVGATLSVLPAEVRLSGAEEATGVRLVNDESAPAFKAVRTDLLYPYRQKELVGQVNALLGSPTISAQDVYSVRKAHAVDGQPNFYYKPQYSSPQYSQAFAEWMVEQYRSDPSFFTKAREALRKHSAP
ncbi:MAG: AlbA family DNA-binding domain-containing protein [Acidiferrobacter sp.]